MENYEYKFTYTGIFSSLYFFQGVDQSIFTAVIPIYLLNKLGTIDSAGLSFMLSIILTPFVFKLLYGILSDKISFKKLGRRKPWIVGSASFAGLMWIFLAFMIPYQLVVNPSGIMLFIALMSVLIMIGVAFSDTVMDGFILDICPKKLLGRTTGTCWAFRSIGIIVGGPIILILITYIDLTYILIALGIFTLIAALLTLKIPHKTEFEKIKMIKNLKSMFKKWENWKLYWYSLFLAVVDGVIFTFISLYILVQAGRIPAAGASLKVLKEDLSLYGDQALITLILGGGVIIGSIIGGWIADVKTRRVCVFSSLALTTIALLLQLIKAPWYILLIFAFIIGISMGWKNSAFSSVSSQYSKIYPEAPSTYFSICTSFINFGSQIGLIVTGIVFNSVAKITTDVSIIFGTVFIVMAILSNVSLIPFLLMKRELYEYKLEGKGEGEKEPSIKDTMKP
ncbi:MAG: MFS transporter [Promethearchaeota archaeon]